MSLIAPVRTERLLATGQEVPGPLPGYDLASLTVLLDEAGLTGRGGGGFPTARKLSAVAQARGRSAVVVNAMEGEPLSRKDAALTARCPRLVLDGLAVVADALGARTRVVAVGDHLPPQSLAAIETAVHSAGGSRRVRLRRLGGGFVAGQESALLRQLDGGPPVPRDPLPRVTERGLGGRPTLVMNAETAAHIALLARHGAAWFREAGLPEDPGTFLATLSGSRPGLLARPGVVEVPRGAPLGSLLDEASLDRSRVRAVLVGGYHGAWVPAADLDAVRLTGSDLAAYGASVGAGIVHALDAADCPLAYAARIADYLAAASARQCGPCVNGLPALAAALQRLAQPGARATTPAEVDRLRGLIDGRGACAHPDGTARFVASTMRVFHAHVENHLRGECDAR